MRLTKSIQAEEKTSDFKQSYAGKTQLLRDPSITILKIPCKESGSQNMHIFITSSNNLKLVNIVPKDI